MSVLPSDGQAVALDRDLKSLAVAKRFVEDAGLSDLADFRAGPALETLVGVAEDYGYQAFDIAFIGVLTQIATVIFVVMDTASALASLPGRPDRD